MEALIDAAHAKGMKVFFDIITNHTADVIDYRGRPAHRIGSKKASPYENADGTAFDDRDYVGNQPLPDDGPGRLLPVHRPSSTATTPPPRRPAWLNDPLMYHNRGDSTFAGESSTYGDFSGLDDLFTERPEVVQGMGDIYKTWVDFGIDGFRIDTVKHVNLEFWQKFVPDDPRRGEGPSRTTTSSRSGRSTTATRRSCRSTRPRGKLQATLDFGFQQQGVDFAKGKPASALADFFAKDDWYTDADSNAYQLPTFLGNHDMGRAAMFLKDASGRREAEHLKRLEFADSLMFTSRAATRSPTTATSRASSAPAVTSSPARTCSPARSTSTTPRTSSPGPRARVTGSNRPTRSTSTSPSCRPFVPSTRPWPMARRSRATPRTVPASSRPRGSVRAPRGAGTSVRSSTSSRRTTTPRRPRRPSRRGPRDQGPCSHRSTAPTRPSSRRLRVR